MTVLIGQSSPGTWNYHQQVAIIEQGWRARSTMVVRVSLTGGSGTYRGAAGVQMPGGLNTKKNHQEKHCIAIPNTNTSYAW